MEQKILPKKEQENFLEETPEQKVDESSEELLKNTKWIKPNWDAVVF